VPVIKCNTRDCGERAQHRGLCIKCYGEAKALVELGQTTWQELQELGLADGPNSRFDTDLKRRREQRE
jgi:hypothetical protein